jgi:hypothetical protein
MEGVDDWDKASSFDAAHPRRSTSSLDANISDSGISRRACSRAGGVSARPLVHRADDRSGGSCTGTRSAPCLRGPGRCPVDTFHGRGSLGPFKSGMDGGLRMVSRYGGAIAPDCLPGVWKAISYVAGIPTECAGADRASASNNRFERSRVASSVSQGGSR